MITPVGMMPFTTAQNVKFKAKVINPHKAAMLATTTVAGLSLTAGAAGTLTQLPEPDAPKPSIATKFRFHREFLEESMATATDISTKEELYEKLKPVWFWEKFSIDDVELKPYGYDSRIDWDTYLVTIKGQPIGFTNGIFEENI